jgi:hypothetical protein
MTACAIVPDHSVVPTFSRALFGFDPVKSIWDDAVSRQCCWRVTLPGWQDVVAKCRFAGLKPLSAMLRRVLCQQTGARIKCRIWRFDRTIDQQEGPAG